MELAKREIEKQKEIVERAKAIIEEHEKKLIEMDQIKTRFFANISHELRTPLTLTIGPIENILSGSYGKITNGAKNQLEMMLRNSRRLLRLINQLLDISKIESGKMKLAVRSDNIVKFTKEITSMFYSLAEKKGISIKINYDREDVEIYFDCDKLEKILNNLLSNAIKFTPENGKICVIISESDEMEPNFKTLMIGRPEMDFISNNGKNGFVEITVKDTGKGIPKEEVPYVFDRFHQVRDFTTKEQSGTGIGLSLVKDLVLLHHGNIKVNSEVGFGSDFIITLPKGKEFFKNDEIIEDINENSSYNISQLAILEMSSLDEILTQDLSELERNQKDVLSLITETILIVDDNKDIREYVRGILKNQYSVLEAKDGEEGLYKAKEIIPDLVITDVMMPKMNGYEFCRALKSDEKLNRIPVMLLTAKVSENDKVEALEIGADEYLPKPFNARELLARVKNLMKIKQQEKELKKINDEITQANEQKSKLLEKLKEQSEMLEKQAREDSLTGIYNRRYLDLRLSEEFKRSVRFNRNLTIAMADIDFFKKINDQFSHQIGDEVLNTIAQILKKNCRSTDIVARYGGEEFVLILPETPLKKAVNLCNKIRKSVEQYYWQEIHTKLKVTISMGLSGNLNFPNHEKLLSSADAKLYEAKHSGRNQIKY
jgi:diguanylate cyclase (GGDEF)-like protein